MLALSKGALARRYTSLQQRAAANGGMVRDVMEQGVEGATAFALGRAQGMGVTDPASSAPELAIVAAGLTGEFLAPNGAVRMVARGARRAGVAVASFKAGLKSGLEATSKT